MKRRPSRRRKPHDVETLPKWAQELIAHLLEPIGTIYNRSCFVCGMPKERDFVCNNCGEDDDDVPYEKRCVPFAEGW